MKKTIFLIFICLIILNTTGQTFSFNTCSCTHTNPTFVKGNSMEVGSSQLFIIVQDCQGEPDTIFYPIGCSQYSIYGDEDSTILQIFNWPFYFYDTDCAIEDQNRPSKNNADIIYKYVLYAGGCEVSITWNLQKYNNLLSLDSIKHYLCPNSFDSDFMSAIVSMLDLKMAVTDIIQQIDDIEQLTINSSKETDEYLCRNELIRVTLPINQHKLTLSGIHQLSKALKKLYSLRL